MLFREHFNVEDVLELLVKDGYVLKIFVMVVTSNQPAIRLR